MNIRTVNKAIAEAGIRAQLVRGTGYYYFVGDDVSLARETGVYGVYRLNDLTLEQWLEEARCKVGDQ